MTDSDTLTSARLAELAKAATPGNWKRRNPPPELSSMGAFVEARNSAPNRASAGVQILGDPDGDYLHREADIDFIAVCGTHRARLVRALRLLEAIESVRERGVPNSDVAAAVLARLDDAEGAER